MDSVRRDTVSARVTAGSAWRRGRTRRSVSVDVSAVASTRSRAALKRGLAAALLAAALEAAMGAAAAVGAVASSDGGAAPYNATACGLELAKLYGCGAPACEDQKTGFINYLFFQHCMMGHSGHLATVIGYIILGAGFLLALVLLEAVTDKYFCTSIKLVVKFLRLSPAVAGVTFLSVGNGSSDVFSSVAAFSSGSPKMGVGTLLGAALFVSLVVVGVVAVLADVRLQKEAFIREVLFLLAAVVYLAWALKDGRVDVGETIGFFSLYVGFVAVVIIGAALGKRRSAQEEKAKARRRAADSARPRVRGTETRSYGSAQKDRGISRGRSRSEGLVLGGKRDDDGASSVGSDRHARPRAWSDSTIVINQEEDEDGVKRQPVFTKGALWTLSFLQTVGDSSAPPSEIDAALGLGDHGADEESGVRSRVPRHAANIKRAPSRTENPLQRGHEGATASNGVVASSPDAKAGTAIAPAGTSAAATDDTSLGREESESLLRETSIGGLAQVLPDSRRAKFIQLLLPEALTFLQVKVVRPALWALQLPVSTAQRLSVPMVEHHMWDWRLAVVNPLGALMLIGWSSFPDWMLRSVDGDFQRWHIVLIVGVLMGAFVWFAAPRDRPPAPSGAFLRARRMSALTTSATHVDVASGRTARVGCSEVTLFCCLIALSFVCSIVWIVLIANELVGIAAAFGLFIGLSDAMVGLTILAIGNSAQDLAADVTIARRGYPSMAVAGAFAGPTFNILMGLGVPLALAIANGHAGISLGQMNMVSMLSFGTMIGGLLFMAIAVPLNGFRITRAIGVMLILIYAAYLVAVIVVEIMDSQ